MRRQNKLTDLSACALTALLLGVSIALNMLWALEVPASLAAVLGLCAGSVLVITNSAFLLNWRKKT